MENENGRGRPVVSLTTAHATCDVPAGNCQTWPPWPSTPPMVAAASSTTPGSPRISSVILKPRFPFYAATSKGSETAMSYEHGLWL
jgi:hypothetical protein